MAWIAAGSPAAPDPTITTSASRSQLVPLFVAACAIVHPSPLIIGISCLDFSIHGSLMRKSDLQTFESPSFPNAFYPLRLDPRQTFGGYTFEINSHKFRIAYNPKGQNTTPAM